VLSLPKTEIEWKWAHIFFNYEFGFLKRGLIGQVFNWLSISTSFDNFNVFSSIMIFLVIWFYYHLIKNMPLAYSFIFGFLFLTSPLLLKNLIYDWGRFDQIAIAYLFACLICLTDKRFHRLSYILLLLSPILLFIHEATILWIFPILLAIAYLEKPKLLYILIPLTCVCFVIILSFGSLKVNPPDYIEQLEKWAAPRWIHFSIVNTLTNSFSHSLEISIPAILPNLKSKQGIIGLIELASLLGLLVFVRSRLIVLFTVASLIIATFLFCVALDHFRWMSLIAFIMLTSLIYAQKKGMLRDSKFLPAYCICLSLMNIFVEPVGIWLTIISL
jgi:hypothetical protein